MTKTLTVEIHPDWNCWIAYKGNDPWESGVIGEGNSREDAVADYWAGVHGMGKTARLIPPEYGDIHWMLYNGKTGLIFDTQAEAIAYAEAHEYLI